MVMKRVLIPIKGLYQLFLKFGIVRRKNIHGQLTCWEQEVGHDKALPWSLATLKNAIKEVSKGECIIMGDFNHGHIQWNSLESTGIEDQQFLFLIQDSFLTQHVLEPTRGENVLDIVLSSQKELVDNVKIFEPLGNSDHNQIHFDINVKSESKKIKTYKRNFHKGNYKDMRKYLAKLDWNNMLMNKTAIECWNILKYEIESIIDKFVPFQKQGKRCRKKHLSKDAIRKIMVKQTMWRVYRRTRKEETMQNTKRHLMQLQLKSDNLKEAMSKN